MREYPLPAGAKPHSVTPDAEGTMWYLGNKNGTIGRLDPESGEITEYPMPDPEARDPHTGEFDDDGRFCCFHRTEFRDRNLKIGQHFQ